MAKSQMVINYVPGEECRVAVVYEGKLHELHAERMDNVSHVGNIYVGKVVNVEAAIQAAFVDFGLEHNGFLHVSDLHPQYFPDADDETTERVGKKTPRRERPPIQECLRRGDEVAVQVLKEGVGTKGPTVTSYLSIPGRFLVMMPQMDRVGVSRKVEDEETRRKMREILDQLDLPEGFGFILRTAGMDRGKLELKRDLAYLQRLWKDMEKRWKTGNKPRLLYSESDLLVRALRDILSSDIDEVVIDNDAALNRAARFLKIVAPRSSTRLVHYTGRAPIFHVTGLEEQIQMIHAREVPLPSGGRLVIDETEALVAIDVNSGKSRDARDAETNAFRTNMEAAEEICRQLRLRDLGGVIVNDLIDMRFTKHRREVEARFKDLLKKDRARWTTAPISEFGILEMTRQRMRGSHESQHFGDCPICRGRGLVQRPDSVATDGLRELSAILDSDRVHRVEMVVGPRIAGELLSAKRRALSRIERTSGKHVDVRVSEAIPVDRITFYAYDDRGADIDVTKLGKRRARPEELVEYELPRASAAENWAAEPEAAPVETAEEPAEPQPEVELHPIEMDFDESDDPAAASATGDEQREDGRGGRRRRRRRGRGGRGRDGEPASQPDQRSDRASAERPAEPPQPARSDEDEPGAEGGGRRRRRRRRGGRGRNRDGAPLAPGAEGATEPADDGPYSQSDSRDTASDSDGEFESSDSGDLEVGAAEASAESSSDFSDDARQGGQPSGDEQGEGGGRRRRRRRRRRGRGGRGGDQHAGMNGAMNGEHPPHALNGAPRDHDEHDDDDQGSSDRFANQPGSAEPEDLDGSFSQAPDDEDELGSDAPTGAPVDANRGGDGGEEGGGRRRRRRRRRGRGGRSSDQQGGGEGGAAVRGSQGQERQNPQADRAPRPEPRPASQPAAPAPKPKPRTLYSSRRKLGPGEKRGLGGGDE